MAPRIQDLVEETANAPGNAASFPLIPVEGAVRFFDAFGTDEFFAAMDDGQTQRQIVRARVTRGSGSDTFQIFEVMWTINRNTTPLVYAGQVRIFCHHPASRTLVLEANGTLGEAYLPYRAAWREIGQPIMVTSPVGSVDFTLPSQFSRFRVEFQNAVPSASAAFWMRLDVGTGFLQTSSAYGCAALSFYNSISTPQSGDLFSEITLALPGIENVFGSVEFSAAGPTERCQGTFQSSSVYSGARSGRVGGFQVIPAGRARGIRLGFVNQTTAGGLFRLLGVMGS